MPATKWRDRVAIERREPAGTITCRPVGLLGAGANGPPSLRVGGPGCRPQCAALDFGTNNQPAGGRWDFIYNSYITDQHPTSPRDQVGLEVPV